AEESTKERSAGSGCCLLALFSLSCLSCVSWFTAFFCSRLLAFDQPQRIGGADEDAQLARDAVRRPGQPRHGTVHLQAARRTHFHAVAAARAASRIQQRQLVHCLPSGRGTPISPATMADRDSFVWGGR